MNSSLRNLSFGNSSLMNFSLGNSRIPQNLSLRVVSETNDEAISFIKPFFDGILNEIASVALLPRNDGISAMTEFLMRSSGQAGG